MGVCGIPEQPARHQGKALASTGVPCCEEPGARFVGATWMVRVDSDLLRPDGGWCQDE